MRGVLWLPDPNFRCRKPPFLHLYSSGQDQLPASSVSARSTPPSVSVSLPPSVLSTRSAISWSDSFSPPSCFGSSTKAILCGYQIQDLCPRCKDSPGCQHRDPTDPQAVPVSAPFSSSTSHIRLPAFLPAIGFLSSLCVCCRSVISLLFCPHAFSAVSVLRTGRSRSSSYHCRSSDSYPPCGRNTARCLRKP